MIVLEWTIAIVTTGLIFVPRASLVLLGAFTLIVTYVTRIGAAPSKYQLAKTALPSPVVIAAFVFLGWALLSSVWSIDTMRSLLQPGLALLILILSVLAVRAVSTLDTRDLWFVKRGILCGFAIGLAYLVIEELTDRGVMRAIVNIFSFVSPPTPSLVRRIGETVTTILPSALNRHLTVLIALFWPVLLIVMQTINRSWQPRTWPKLLALTVVALTTYVVFASDHDSSKLALLASLIAFSVTWFWPKPARYIFMALWIGATLLMVPTVEVMERAGMKETTLLPSTGRDRIYIWSHTVREFYKSPIIGIGAAGTPVANAQVQNYDKSFEHRLNRHAHNMYLQNSFELGMIGAVLLCIFGLAVISALGTLGSAYLPFALAHFSVIATLCSVSYGLWQFWLIAVFALSVIAFKIATTSNDKASICAAN